MLAIFAIPDVGAFVFKLGKVQVPVIVTVVALWDRPRPGGG